MTIEIITIGKYKFNIKDNISTTKDGLVYNRNFKIRGNYEDCVNVSITYNTIGKAISAKIPTLVYDEECSIESPLDRGEGTIIMIKTLLIYINNKIPEINEFVFEDKSNIECGTDERPLVLYYFSIAFNCMTWYEKHFNAYQQDLSQHREYRTRIRDLLKKNNMKPSFNEFLLIAQPPMNYIKELKSLYEKSNTYGEFFTSIPKNDRCRLVREWLPTFMGYYLKGVFDNTYWVINVIKMDEKQDQCGGTRKKTKYYCPLGRVKLSFTYIAMGYND